MATLLAINPTTQAILLAGNSNAKEQKWVMNVHWQSRGKNPFWAMTAGAKAAGPKFSGRPIIEVMETRVVKGDTVQFQTGAPLGGEGIQGDNQRSGNEETIKNGGYSFTVGRMWNGIGFTSVAANMTVIGTKIDKESGDLLGEWLGWRKAQDIEFEMIVNTSGFTLIFPNSKGSREQLNSTDTLNMQVLEYSRILLSTLQAKPVRIGKSKSGAPVFCYTAVTNQYAAGPLKQSANYLNLLANARDKGDTNEIWAGGMPDLGGVSVYEWTVEDTAGNGKIGSPAVPRAYLGNAIAAGTAVFNITGGGTPTAAALTQISYFLNFSNSFVQGFEGQKRAADTTTVRYVLIQNIVDSGLAAGGGAANDILHFGFYSYSVNTGNVLTVIQRLGSAASVARVTTLGHVTWNTAPWIAATFLTDAHAAGSVVMEANSYGVPFVRTYVMGDGALVSGYGTVDGAVCMGNRVTDTQDYGRVKGIGIDACWGVKAVPRVDGLINGYAVIESAIQPANLPVIIF